MTAPDSVDIAIIGGGMVGASLACLLGHAQPGWSIALIEAFPFPEATVDSGGKAAPAHYQPSFDARSTAIAQGSVEVFQRLQLWETLAQHATPIRQVHVSDRGHLGGTVIDAAERGLAAVGYVIENAWLGAVLLNRVQQLPQITCLAPARVTQITPRQCGVSLQITEDGAPGNTWLSARLAVIADGGDSPLRQALGIAADIKEYQQQAIIANVSFNKPHHQIAFERFTDQGPLALLPLSDEGGDHRSALVWTQPRDRADAIMALDDHQFLAELQERFGYRLGHFRRVGKRWAYPLQLITAREQIRSHIAIMGNAAHFLHPVAGQGFNLALRDCATLTEVLRDSQRQNQALGSLDSLLEYQRLQTLDQLATVNFSDTITRLFSTAQLPAAILRNLGFLGLELLPSAKTLLAEQSMGKAMRQAQF